VFAVPADMDFDEALSASGIVARYGPAEAVA
jgi:hypothetical protein